MVNLLAFFLCFVSGLFSGNPDPPSGSNILWNSSFETGIGNGPWGVVPQVGPNTPDLWYPEGYHGAYSARLSKPICSKRYDLGTEASTWRVSFYARALSKASVLTLKLTNQNHHKQKNNNTYSEKFQIGKNWAGYHFDFELRDVVRPLFHLEFRGAKKSDLLIDAVMLYEVESPGVPDLPFHGCQDVETGFLVPEITNTFVDGEERLCSVVTVNNTARQLEAGLSYTIYDVRERPVESHTVSMLLDPGEIRHHPVQLEHLPYNAYRLSSSVPDGAQSGDALIAILPRIQEKNVSLWGCNASLEANSIDYSIRLMKKLGMGFVTSISTGQHLGRWKRVERKPGELQYYPEIPKILADSGIVLNLYLGAGRPPEWVFTLNGLDRNKPDPDLYSILFSEYVSSMIGIYGGTVRYFTLEDEVSGIPLFKGNRPLYAQVHKTAYKAAHEAAAKAGVEVFISTNESYPKRFTRYWESIGSDHFDFISTNSIANPGYIQSFLHRLAARGADQDEMFIPAVGKRCRTRPVAISTSVRGLNKKKAVTGEPPKKPKKKKRFYASYFVWETVKALWMSRPYGPHLGGFAPVIHHGFYELRAHGNSPYLPNTGYTGVEFDNSPNPGFQAVACFRFLLGNRQAWRSESTATKTHRGLPLPNDPRIEMYSFRNAEDALIVLLPGDGDGLRKDFTVTLPAGDWQVYDFFANSLKGEKIGETITYAAREFPIYVKAQIEGASRLIGESGQIRIRELE